MSDRKHIWLAIHLYYANDRSQVLHDTIYRYVQWVLKSGIVCNFFYIHSKEQGPHLRLRFRTRVESKKILQDNLKEYFSNFLEDNPSARHEPIFDIRLEKKNSWNPNNTIQFSSYTVDKDRFGGDIGINICCRQFQISSLSVLKFYGTKSFDSLDNQSDILGAAFNFNFTFAFAMGLNLREMSLFFKQIYNQWLPFAYSPDDINLEPFYQKEFQSNKSSLKQTMLSIIKSIETGDILEDEILGNWFIQNKNLAKTFANQVSFLENRSNKYAVTFTHDVPLENYTIWAIWMDLIHFNNNRMCIVNQEEAYLAFILYMTIDEIIGVHTPATVSV